MHVKGHASTTVTDPRSFSFRRSVSSASAGPGTCLGRVSCRLFSTAETVQPCALQLHAVSLVPRISSVARERSSIWHVYRVTTMIKLKVPRIVGVRGRRPGRLGDDRTRGAVQFGSLLGQEHFWDRSRRSSPAKTWGVPARLHLGLVGVRSNVGVHEIQRAGHHNRRR